MKGLRHDEVGSPPISRWNAGSIVAGISFSSCEAKALMPEWSLEVIRQNILRLETTNFPLRNNLKACREAIQAIPAKILPVQPEIRQGLLIAHTLGV